MRPVLRMGNNGPWVGKLQRLLGIDDDNAFGPATDAAVREFQKANGLDVDGVVGGATWPVLEAKGTDTKPPPLSPYLVPNFRTIQLDQRVNVFGDFTWSDHDDNGWIKIEDDWAERHIERIRVPQLEGVKGYPGWVDVHTLARDPMLRFFQGVERAGLRNRLLTWAGCWAPRRIRRLNGFSPRLSSHAWGTAFDINVPWNYLGATPAPVGSKGSVLELLPIAYACGFYWGGLFKRRDGMHFELALT